MKPIALFKLIFNHNFMNNLSKETVKYSFQKEYNILLSVEELYQYFGILILSGCHPLPSRRMYWETRRNTNSYFVSATMSRNRFEQIHRFLHVAISYIDQTNRVYKVRPLIIQLNDYFA